MRIRMMILVLFLTLLAGCSTISIYVLDKEELVRVKAGQTVNAKFDGWILSDRAVQRVMDARVKDANLK